MTPHNWVHVDDIEWKTWPRDFYFCPRCNCWRHHNYGYVANANRNVRKLKSLYGPMVTSPDDDCDFRIVESIINE